MKSKENKHFSFLQRQGTITASDSTRLTDVVNLRRMLHEDFVSDLDNTFVRTHRFAVNEEYEGDPGVVELAYRSTKHDKDHGRIVVDTLHNIIRSASRISGKDCNQSLRTSAFMLTTARLLSGYVIRVWDVDYRVTYTEHQGNWLPSEVRYKFYFKNTESRPEKLESEFNKKTGGRLRQHGGHAEPEVRQHGRNTRAHRSTKGEHRQHSGSNLEGDPEVVVPEIQQRCRACLRNRTVAHAGNVPTHLVEERE